MMPFSRTCYLLLFVLYACSMFVSSHLLPNYNGYPYKVIEEYLNKSGLVKEISELNPTSPTDCINFRIEDMSKNCCTKTEISDPYIVNHEGKLKYVLQSDQFRQSIKYVQCGTDVAEASCFNDLQVQFPYATKCSTNFVQERLLVYDVETKTADWIDFPVPGSCSCKILQQS